MSDHDTQSSTNTAEEGATIGIQAEQVHNSNVYVVAPEDPPEREYEVGVNYLKTGVPMQARERISKAIARGFKDAEVWFHWALAMLSKRSYRELSADERAQLAHLPEHLDRSARDEWTRALETLCELLGHLERPNRDHSHVMAKLRNLPVRQREKITHHCDLVLTGGMKDSFWVETRDDAQERQHANDRNSRVWAYFEPAPIPARARYPAPNSATPEDRLRAALGTALSAGGLACLGWILLQNPGSTSVIAYLVLVASGVVMVIAGFEWRYRLHRLCVKEGEHTDRMGDREPPGDGFAKQVDEKFRYYACKYAPDGVDRSVWLAETRGIRTTLRDEVVGLYRENRIPIGRVTWLIRFLVRDVQRRWKQNLLFAYRQHYRTPLSLKVWFLAGGVIGSLAAWTVLDAAVSANPLLTLVSVLAVVVSGRPAAFGWWRLIAERRRFDEETREWAYKYEARKAEYQRWTARLDATRPTEEEMERWLWCDRALLIDEALRHYRLAWQDVTAHTVVQTPVRGAKRARVNHGPRRSSRYELRLFLLTADGVRELARQLTVEDGEFHGCERGHFRFDAVSSLRVFEYGYSYALELTLTNGPARTIAVTEPDRTDAQTNGDGETTLARISLDSTGFTHALHVLEGIAAEGKAWIQHDVARTDDGAVNSASEIADNLAGAAAREPQRVP